jgi:hypothetical protein
VGISQQQDGGFDEGAENAGQPQQETGLGVGQLQFPAQRGQGGAGDAEGQFIEKLDEQKQQREGKRDPL